MNELTAAKPIEQLSSAKRKLLDALLNGRPQTQSSRSSQVILRRDPMENPEPSPNAPAYPRRNKNYLKK